MALCLPPPRERTTQEPERSPPRRLPTTGESVYSRRSSKRSASGRESLESVGGIGPARAPRRTRLRVRPVPQIVCRGAFHAAINVPVAKTIAKNNPFARGPNRLRAAKPTATVATETHQPNAVLALVRFAQRQGITRHTDRGEPARRLGIEGLPERERSSGRSLFMSPSRHALITIGLVAASADRRARQSRESPRRGVVKLFDRVRLGR